MSDPAVLSFSRPDSDPEADINRAVVMRYAEEVWNGHDFTACDELFSGAHEFHDPLIPLVGPGAEGARQHFAVYTAAYPDCRLEIEELLCWANRAVVRWWFTGTHLGALKGIAPTGRHIEITGMHLIRFVRARMAETWVHYDALAMFQQLGVIPIIGPPPLN